MCARFFLLLLVGTTAKISQVILFFPPSFFPVRWSAHKKISIFKIPSYNFSPCESIDLIAIPVFFSFILFTLVSPRHVCITCVCRRTVCFRFSKAWTSSGLITLDRTDLWTRSASNNRNSIADNRAKSTIYYETMRREVSII